MAYHTKVPDIYLLPVPLVIYWHCIAVSTHLNQNLKKLLRVVETIIMIKYISHTVTLCVREYGWLYGLYVCVCGGGGGWRGGGGIRGVHRIGLDVSNPTIA